ncbi:SLBB domain-containing protein [Ancylothrix sp. C2]|uniref:SLBB domain-containing protein n=1 Tax=Ancylothrix sp. D3o TaxID=2953691 RepID=UPI0021BA60BF|nr:SLBB domain-containing protein [Ancylothrix sp. D3o]MCT7952137.1 SLBB domain-containing protein [Ancylothrix sp. D3o]
MRTSIIFYLVLAFIAQNLSLTASAYSSLAFAENTPDASKFIVNAGTPTSASNQSPVAQLPVLAADIQNHWAKSFIQPLIARGIFSSFSDSNFRPELPVNRAQFATIIQQAFPQNPIRGAGKFADVPADYWAYNAIQKSYQMGFFNSNSNLFNPTQNITRLEALTALVEGLKLQATTVKPENLNAYFEDAAAIPVSLRNSVAAAVENRLVVSYPNVRLLNPSQVATRAEIAAFVHQALLKTGQLSPSMPVANRPQNSPPPPVDIRSSMPVFTQPPQGFSLQPTLSALQAVETDYTLGAGDRIRLDILNVPEYSGEFQVLVNGAINLPLIGKVDLKGLTLERASAVISSAYSYYIREPIVTVSLLAPRPLKVAISGEVNRPGSYTMGLSGSDGKGGIQFPTLTQAIQLAGGINQTAALRQVLVRRPQRNGADQIIAVDLWALLREGDLRQDISLQDGDTVFIPTAVNPNLAEASRVATSSFSTPKTEPLNIAVVGEVSKPGSYTIRASENGDRPTLTRAIREAGGITQSADIRQISIRRLTQTGAEQLVAIDLWQLLRGGNLEQDVILQQGDTILIPTANEVNLAEAAQLVSANISADQTQPVNVAVVGEIARPGTHVVKVEKAGELPTVTRAIQVAGGITQLADIRKIQVRRITRDGNEKTLNLDLWQLLQSGDMRQDAILQTGDTIVIPTAIALNETEANQLAAASFSPQVMAINVVGEVVKPGVVQLSPNTPLNQAILAAGGFNNRARKGSVDLIRLNPNGTVSKRSIDIDFEQGLNEENNPSLRPGDVVVVGKSGLAGVTDTLGSILSPLGGVFSLFNFFRIFQ